MTASEIELTASAEAILELCDGHRTVEEIVATLEERYMGDGVEAVTRRFIDLLSRHSLLEDADR